MTLDTDRTSVDWHDFRTELIDVTRTIALSIEPSGLGVFGRQPKEKTSP